MIMLLLVINATLVIVMLECLDRMDKMSKHLDLILKLYSEALVTIETSKDVVIESVPIIYNYDVIFKIVVVVIVVCVVYKGCCFFSETSTYKIAKFIDSKTSNFLDYFVDSKIDTTFVDHSNGYQAVFTKHGNICKVMFKDPSDDKMKSISDLLDKLAYKDPSICIDIVNSQSVIDFFV